MVEPFPAISQTSRNSLYVNSHPAEETSDPDSLGGFSAAGWILADESRNGALGGDLIARYSSSAAEAELMDPLPALGNAWDRYNCGYGDRTLIFRLTPESLLI